MKKIEISDVLKALKTRVDLQKNEVHMIWLHKDRSPVIELNRRTDSLHGKVNDEVGYMIDHKGVIDEYQD